MNSTKFNLSSPHTSNPWPTKCPFNFVIAYQDTATRNRVFHLYDHLAQQLFGEFDFRGTWYRFDFLANETVRRAAVQEATRAQMIVISLRQSNTLPGHVIHWIDAWSSRRSTHKSALVALVAGEDKKSPLHDYLQKIAHRSGMDYFANHFALSDGGPARARARSPLAFQSDLDSPSPRFQKLPSHSRMTSHWGINE